LKTDKVVSAQPVLDNIDKLLLNILQMDFPMSLRPFDVLAKRLEITSGEVIERVKRLKENGVIRQISAIFDSHSLGYSSALVAMRVDPPKLDAAAAVVSRHPSVSHNYARDHVYNLWFTLTTPPGMSPEEEAKSLAYQAGAEAMRLLPTIRLFKIGVAFDMTDSPVQNAATSSVARTQATTEQPITEMDVRVVRALQEDLPLEPRPFKRLAERFNLTEDQMLDRARAFIRSGTMRRFAATLRHRAAGFGANAMGVWIVPDERAEEIGKIMAGFSAVSHCYQRPTYPDWPYSLFTMIHARTREECEAVAAEISQATGIADYRLLYSTREYKKNRVKYFNAAESEQ
jgi:siroheme decarboxylase